MSKKFQLQIPEPCHESWHNMSPVDKGRFCDFCQKAVHDFTGMSDSQLIAFFKKPSTGSICGRFNNERLDRDFEIRRKRLPWIKYFLQLLIPAFLLTSKAKSQGELSVKGETVLVDSKRLGKVTDKKYCKPDNSKLNKITGSLKDNKGTGIPYATVTIKGSRSGVVADANGNFSIGPLIDRTPATLIFSSVGFQTKEVTIDTNKRVINCSVELSPMLMGPVGAVVVIGRPQRKRREPITLFQRIFKDTSSKFFKAYPNPVSTGEVLKLELNKAVADEYQADLINQNGQLIHSATVIFEKENQLNTFTIPKTTPGVHFLRMTNKKTGKNHSEKIIIQ